MLLFMYYYKSRRLWNVLLRAVIRSCYDMLLYFGAKETIFRMWRSKHNSFMSPMNMDYIV